MMTVADYRMLEDLPEPIKDLNAFVLWEQFHEGGEAKKRPFDWRTPSGRGKGNDDVGLHLSFQSALAKLGEIDNPDVSLALYQPQGGSEINLERKGYLHILDLDGFVCNLDGRLRLLGLGWDIVHLCNDSYMELSPSGNGVKIFIVSDLLPSKKQVFQLPPNEYSSIHPEVKKYGASHAVEIFSQGFWNCITGDVWDEKLKELKFLPASKLQDVIDLVKSKAATKSKPPILERLVEDSLTQSKNRLTRNSLITLLAKIDNQSEQVWSDVANSLARVYGGSMEDVYVLYSKGDFNGCPYLKFDELAVRNRYRRALKEVSGRAGGYGVSHLARLASVDIASLEFEGPPVVSTPIINASGITAAELATKTFPPLIWVVQDILPEGSYILSARPKVGKSWLALQICLGVAFGNTVFGKQVIHGKAIYLALEDNHRRLQSRLKLLRPQGYSTPNLILHTDWPAFDKGGIEKLIDAIETEHPKIIVIDTLAKVRPPMGRNSGVYEADYKALAPLTTVANKYRCTILVVTHNRKGKAETDPLEQISGSLGLSGAVDGALIIDGNRSDKTYTLSLIGRDIPNDDDLAISRQANGEWHLLGQAKQVFVSEERREISELLKLHPNGLKPKDVADLLGKKQGTIRKLLTSMLIDQQLESSKGVYTHPNAIGSNGGIGNSGNSSNEVTTNT